MTTTYYRLLPASTPEQRAAIDGVFARREAIEREYQRRLAEWLREQQGDEPQAVQLALFDGEEAA